MLNWKVWFSDAFDDTCMIDRIPKTACLWQPENWIKTHGNEDCLGARVFDSDVFLVAIVENRSSHN